MSALLLHPEQRNAANNYVLPLTYYAGAGPPGANGELHGRVYQSGTVTVMVNLGVLQNVALRAGTEIPLTNG